MDVELTAQVRTGRGKGAARSLRRESRIPAVLYGPKTEPLALSVADSRLEKLMRDMGNESKLLQLTIEGAGERQTRQVLIREVQTHPVQRRFLHVDFYEVPMDQPIVVEVPVELVGDPIGVKKGGAIDVIRRTLSVRCLPGEIPEKVQIDIGDLDLGAAIHVSDLVGRVPFELMDDPSFAVLTLNIPGEGSKAAAGEEEGETEA